MQSIQMGSHAHETYKHPCKVHANYEQFILQYVESWHGGISRQYPCILLYGERIFYTTQEGTSALMSVYILLQA